MKKVILGIVLQVTIFWPLISWSALFINEIHYDNIGPDTGEAVEIAGSAGTDLTGWSIVLYNGNGGIIYDTIPLAGVIPKQSKNFGTLVFYPPNISIQNGSPDGLALVDPLNNVIQFLSYEGSFVANEGPAIGMQSIDIGVIETAAPIGYSLQNTGLTADSKWSGPLPNTFGALNAAQLYVGAPTIYLLLFE